MYMLLNVYEYVHISRFTFIVILIDVHPALAKNHSQLDLSIVIGLVGIGFLRESDEHLSAQI